MPSPIGHSLMGLIIYRATGKPIGAPYWQPLVGYVVAANAPDLDFLPGLAAGDLSMFHHGPSHSVGFAALFGLFGSFFFSRAIYGFIIAFGLYLSHIVLDYLIQDPSPPYGVPLFWPLSPEYFMAPFAFFRRFDYLPRSVDSIVSGIFSLNNFLTIITEIVFLLPLLFLVSVYKKVSAGDSTGVRD